MLLGFISRLLHSSTWLFVTSKRMTIGHNHNVLVLVVVGAPANRHTRLEMKPQLPYITAEVYSTCVLLLPDKQLSKAALDGAVSVCPLANVLDFIDVALQGLTLSVHVAQLSHNDDVVTVVQRS